ncbi:hypothetical protein Gpo141_00013400 [Globisporangium polare]
MELLARVARRQAALQTLTAAAAVTTGSATTHLHQQQPRLLPLLSTRAPSSRLQLRQTRSFGVQSAATGHLLQPRAEVQQHPSVHQDNASHDGGVAVLSGATDEAAQSDSSADALKTVLMAPGSSFQEAYSAYETLRNEAVLLREKHYLSLVYKACREGRYVDVKDVFDAFVETEASGKVLLPPRADRTWNYLSFERLQMHRFVLWSMLDAKKYRQMNAFFRQHVHGRPNKWSLFESDPLNFLLRAECTGRFADEQDLEWKLRVDKILAKMEMWRFNASYSSSHALFRFLLYHPDVFIAQELSRDASNNSVSRSTNPNYGSLTLGDVFVRYFSRYPKALRRDPKRISIATSAAAAAGQHDVVKAILRDAELHTIRIDAVSFAHAVECAESEEKRMEIVKLYVKAKERNAIYTTQDEPTSISNYLLLYAIFDGNFRHMMELLHEMQLYNNAASNKTVEELFQSVAKYRAQIRLEEQETPENAAKLSECPTIEQLLNDFHSVIPRNVHTITQGVVQSLRSGDLQVALRLVRATVRTTDIVLRSEIYAQLVYPLLARGSAQYDELELVEVERFYDAQHPRERVYLNAQVLNLCESHEDFVATLACLDRWQLQRHAPLSRRAMQRVFDIVSKQLQQLRQHKQGQHDGDKNKKTAAILVEGVELSYLAFLKRYFDIIPLDAWTFGNAIIRSGTSGLDADVVLLLHQAHGLGLVLEKTAYRIALQVLESQGMNAEIVECVKVIEGHGVWTELVEKFPDVQVIADRGRTSLSS